MINHCVKFTYWQCFITQNLSSRHNDKTLNEQKKFNYYRLAQTSTIFPAPGDFTIYGSNDNLAYTTINQQTDYGIVGPDNVWNPKILVGEQQYKYIVFQVTKLKAGVHGGSLVSVWNLDVGYQ